MPVEFPGLPHADSVTGHGIVPSGLQPLHPGRKLFIILLKPAADLPVISFLQPETESRTKVMVPGQGIVKAEALGPLPHQAHGNPGFVLRVLLMEHGAGVSFIVVLCQF